MLATTFKGIAEVYYREPSTLLDFYDQLSSFISSEIKNGQPAPKDAEGENSSVLFDLMANHKTKHIRDNSLDDSNFLVNRTIAQNLHFFFGAFV